MTHFGIFLSFTACFSISRKFIPRMYGSFHHLRLPAINTGFISQQKQGPLVAVLSSLLSPSSRMLFFLFQVCVYSSTSSSAFSLGSDFSQLFCTLYFFSTLSGSFSWSSVSIISLFPHGLIGAFITRMFFNLQNNGSHNGIPSRILARNLLPNFLLYSCHAPARQYPRSQFVRNNPVGQYQFCQFLQTGIRKRLPADTLEESEITVQKR